MGYGTHNQFQTKGRPEDEDDDGNIN